MGRNSQQPRSDGVQPQTEFEVDERIAYNSCCAGVGDVGDYITSIESALCILGGMEDAGDITSHS